MSVQIKGVGTIGGIDQGLNTVGVITATSLVGTGVSVVGVITATTFSGCTKNSITTSRCWSALFSASDCCRAVRSKSKRPDQPNRNRWTCTAGLWHFSSLCTRRIVATWTSLELSKSPGGRVQLSN